MSRGSREKEDANRLQREEKDREERGSPQRGTEQEERGSQESKWGLEEMTQRTESNNEMDMEAIREISHRTTDFQSS